MFDARAAKALKAGDHLTVPQAPGLRLKATQTLKTWVYRFRSPDDGKLRQVRIGHWPAMGLPQAISAWEKLRAERVAGVDPAARKRAAKKEQEASRAVKAYTVRRVCDEFLADYQGRVTDKTYRWAEQLLSNEVLGDLASLPVASVTRREAYAALERMADRPVAAAKLRQLLGQAWDLGLDAGRLQDETPNWWRQLMRGKLVSKGKIIKGEHQGQAVKRVLSEAELRKLLPWLPNFTRDIEDALRLYLWTGCRGAEIVGMRRSELADEADGLWWTIPKERRKTRRNSETTDLRVPLIGQAEAVVRRRMEAAPGDVLWPSHGALGHVHQKALGVAVWTHMPDCDLRKEWVRPRLPVTGWAPHDLRRTARTLLAAMGCPDEIAEAIIGHKIEGVKGVYNRHRYDAERREWLTRLSAHLDGLCGPDPATSR